MGQLHAQLSASEQSHSIWREDLHHPLCLSGGTHLHWESKTGTPTRHFLLQWLLSKCDLCC